MHVIYSEETCKRWGNKAGDGEEAEQEWAQVKAHLGLITGGSGVQTVSSSCTLKQGDEALQPCLCQSLATPAEVAPQSKTSLQRQSQV